MSLLPNNRPELLDDFLEAETQTPKVEPSKTYRINFETGRISGMVDEKEALKQFIKKALLTNRSHYRIYSDDYGCEIEQLIGRNVTDSFLQAEIPRMVREALVYDDRINEVTNVTVERQGDAIFISATVDSIYGEVEQEVII